MLPAVTVSAESGADGAALSPSVQAERQRLARLPGASNLVLPQQEARLATLRDALDYQPGVVLQDFFGATDQPRLSIRGSGIQSNPVNRGVLLLQDGLPLNEADGSFVIGLLEPRNAALVSVRRGANTLTPSATQLGGELDFQSLTGADQKGLVRLESGRFGRQALQGAVGRVGEQWDGRISVSGDRFDGFRHHSASRRQALHANLGLQGGGVENRSYLSWTDLAFEIPNVVPKERVGSQPQGVMGDGNTPQDQLLNIYRRDPRRETRQLRLANRTRWGQEALRQELGLYAQHTDDWFKDPGIGTRSDNRTLGAQWRIDGQAGQLLRWHAALAWSRSQMERGLRAVSPANGSELQQFGNYRLRAENLQGQLGADWQLAPDWSLVGQLGWSRQSRDGASRQTGQSLDQQWTFATPKLGLNWQLTPATRLWANLSRSQEAPTFWDIVSGTVANPANPASASSRLTRLEVQRATTWELGGQGHWGQGARATQWQLAYYRSQLADEILSVSNAYGQALGTTNYAGGTRHQGLEAGLSGSWALGASQALDWRGSWTYSDFRFKDGAYAGKRIAGVPRHLINAELLWRGNSGQGRWRVGPNLRWMPQATSIDHANTPGSTQDAYALLGLRLEWTQGPWRAWLLAENLTDRRYASSFAIRDQASAAQPGYLPGLGRSLALGLSYQFE
ncbi:TonB-dependent receptor [Melaminivora sp.]